MIVYATELCTAEDEGIGWGFSVVLSGLRAAGIAINDVSLYGPRPADRPDVWLISLPYAGDVWRLRPFFDLSGESMARSARDGRTLYLMGGHGVVNPDPLLDVVDAVFLGEADDRLDELARTLPDRARLAEVPGVDMGTGPVLWQMASSLDRRGTYQNRGSESHGVHATTYFEVARGCRNKCRFCEIGWAYGYCERPREQTEAALAVGDRWLVLSAPDTGGVSYYTDLIRDGLYRPRWRSTRVATYLRELGARVHSGSSKIRFGVEGVTETLRSACLKPVSTSDLRRATGKAISDGYKMVRFFLIGGLPTETRRDRTEINALISILERSGLCHWKAGEIKITGLSPQPFTPWQRYGIAGAIESITDYRQWQRQARSPWWRSVLIDHHSTEADLVKRMGRGQLVAYLAVREPREQAGRRDVEGWARAAGIDYRTTVLDDWPLSHELPWSRVVHPLREQQAAGEAAWWRASDPRSDQPARSPSK